MPEEISQKIRREARWNQVVSEDGDIYFCSMDECHHMDYLGRPCIFESRNPDISDYRCPIDFNKSSVKSKILKLEDSWKTTW